MKNHVNGQVMAIAEPPVSLGELRQHVLRPLIGNSLFSAAEQLRANHFVHESDDIARLIRWGANVLAEIACRQSEAARRRRHCATSTMLGQLRAGSFRGHRPRSPRLAPAWEPGTFLPDRNDRRAGTFDRSAAARFQPVDSLAFATLLRCPRR